MKKSEFFAASQFLTNWPDGCSFLDVLQGVENEDPAYVIDINYRDWKKSGLSYEIEITEARFCRAVADILNEEKNPQPVEAFNAQMGDPVQFLKDHFQIINVKG